MTASLRILADENIPAVEHYFSVFGEVLRVPGRDICAAQLRDVDVLLVRSVTRVDAALLADSRVGFVGSATIGTDHVDTDYLRSRQIRFANAPGSNANSVVEYVIAALCQLEPVIGNFLDKRIGIVGMGNVGRRLAMQAQQLGMSVCCSDPLIDMPTGFSACTLEEVLACDIVSLHTPLTLSGPHATQHLLNRERIEALAPGTTLINSSRGAVVDNAALLDRLTRRADLQVVLDVWEGEPQISVDLLARVSIATSHIAGYSYDGKITGTTMLYDDYLKYLVESGGADVEPLRVKALTNDDRLPLAVPAGVAGDVLKAICALVIAAYPIGRDDRALRQLNASDMAKGFDLLRKQYPVRREWRNYRLSKTDVLSGKQIRMLTGLGFSIQALK